MNNTEYILKIKKFSMSKIGEEDNENKDSMDFNKFNGAFCISDGVSGASFSRDWSKLIVSNFIENPFENKKKYDSVVVAVGHDKFKVIKQEQYNNLLNNEKIIIDVKGIVPESSWRL